MVLGDVLEVLAEERAVEEGNHAAVGRDHLRRLVGDAVHLSADAVALDEVAHAHTSRHERDAVEEVLEQVLHGETDTGGETGRDDRNGGRRDAEHLDGYDEVGAPYADGYDVVGECEVRLAVDHDLRLVILVVERLDEVVEIAEHEELRRHHDQFEERKLHHVGHVEEVGRHDFHHRLGEVEHVGRPPDGEEDGDTSGGPGLA